MDETKVHYAWRRISEVEAQALKVSWQERLRHNWDIKQEHLQNIFWRLDELRSSILDWKRRLSKHQNRGGEAIPSAGFIAELPNFCWIQVEVWWWE